MRVWHRRVNRPAGADPGLNRFRGAPQAALTIALILVAEALFVHVTRALQTQAAGAAHPAAKAAQVAAAHHAFLVIAAVLGAIVRMLSSFAVVDTTARSQLISELFLPVPMIGALALGIALGRHRTLALMSFAVLVAAGTYSRRFSPRGFIAAMLLFMGDFLGFFPHSYVTLEDLGWLVARIGVGTATELI